MKNPRSYFSKYYLVLFLLLISVGIFFRFYNLNWGSPFFFHPDERNIASAIARLEFPSKLNPEFFAYGSLPIYTTYFLGVLKNLIFSTFSSTEILKVNFEDAILLGGLLSFSFSIGVLYYIFRTAKILANRRAAFIATLLASFSVGFIQYAHFMTFEMWLAFLTALLLLRIVKYSSQNNPKNFTLISLVLGLLISVKISSLIFIPISYLVVFIIDFHKTKGHNSFGLTKLEKITLKIIVGLASIVTIFAITSPFFFFDKERFLSSLNYEIDVATGKLPVFYTQGFIDSIPVLYQIQKVYPFILNPLVLLIFLLTFPIIIFKSIKKRDLKLLLAILFLFTTFISQAFLYVKWVRYYIPTLPFIYILLGIYLAKIQIKIQKILLSLLLLVSLLYSFAYFKSNILYSSQIEGSKWFAANISEHPKTLSEIYDMGIVPFNSYADIKLFNFYDLETNLAKQEELNNLVLESKYVVLPSQRILKDRIKRPDLFPNGNKFYLDLLDESLGFKKIYETQCDIFCKILYANDPAFSFESTANVFDRPQVLIFKRSIQ